MTVKPKVLLLGVAEVIDAHILTKYEEFFTLVHYNVTTKDEFISELKSRFDDIVGIATVWFSFAPIGGLRDEKVINALPESLRIITTPTVGYDMYDLAALKKRGIVLANAPGIASDEVADIALHLALSSYRYTSLFEKSLKIHKHTLDARYAVEAEFDKTTGRVTTDDVKARRKLVYGHIVGNSVVHSPRGQIAGIVGFGSIGRAIAKRLAVLGMKIHYLKRTPLNEQEIEELGGTGLSPPFDITRHDTFESLAKVSQLLVLVVPLTPQTRHILNEKTIQLVPHGARIVNVGRGPLIDQKALLKGLQSGQISSVGLDVFEHEPLVEPELLDRDDVTLLPHVGSCTGDGAQSALENCFINIQDVILGDGKARHVILD